MASRAKKQRIACATNKGNLASIAANIMRLQPILIDPSKCTPQKSLYRQIINDSQATSERQAKQFNLGNAHCTANPMHAADFILEREYGDSSLFVKGEHASVFIPPTFVSNQYKKSSTAILDYDVGKDIGRLLGNLKQNSQTYWLTRELETFINTQNIIDGIDKKAYDQWILNLQILYLVILELKTDQLILPSTTSDLGIFLQSIIALLPSPSSTLKALLLQNLFTKHLRRKIKQMIELTPSEDSNLQWLFGLELSEVGEKMEHWFHNQLLLLKDDILQDTVVLSSLTFLTNLKNKMHKETDCLIISWKKKLIISVELKRSIVDEKVFKQLKSNHQIFEERLGDQLISGWTYFPVVCVEKDDLSLNSQHYITTEIEFKAWLTSIFNKLLTVPITSTPDPLDEVKGLLKILVFAIHVSKKDQLAPITSSTWVEYTSNAIENVSTSHNILFYSNQQIAIMNNDDPRYKRVLICGHFGVGKSILLTHKAIMLNKQPDLNGKVMYVVGHKHINKEIRPMLLQRLKKDLEENHGIFVDHFDGLDDDGYPLLLGKIKSRDIKALFFDECNVYLKGQNWTEELASLVDYLWIVPATLSLGRRSHREWTANFTLVNLEQNFRNSRQIVEATKSFAEEKDYEYKEGIVMPPGNFPGGCEPIFVDLFEDAVKEARKRTNGGILVIVSDEIDVQDYYELLNQSNENVKAYHNNRNDFDKGENPYVFLLDGNVLIIDKFASLGFEWTTVILAEQDDYNSIAYRDCNYMLRCTTNLIVVKKDDDSMSVDESD
ncbi:uncharacterized protein [Clytia hemisphaerica]|uniref:uncharacterized protein n=1 Tax=Clytia hemisphaerica TaxID=252671 RepID=UPI0034D3CB1D